MEEFETLLSYPKFFDFLNLCFKPTKKAEGILLSPWSLKEPELLLSSQDGEPPENIESLIKENEELEEEKNAINIEMRTLAFSFLQKGEELVSFCKVLN